MTMKSDIKRKLIKVQIINSSVLTQRSSQLNLREEKCDFFNWCLVKG